MVGQQLEHGTFDSGCRSVGFQASFTSATADTAGFVNYNVAQLTGKTVMTVDQFAVGNETASEASTQCNHQKVFHAFGTAINHLTDGCSIGVIGDDYRNSGEITFDLFNDVQHTFPNQVRSEFDRSGVVVAIGCTDADTHQFNIVACPFEEWLNADIKLFDVLIEIGIITSRENTFTDDLTLLVNETVNGVGSSDIYAYSYFFHGRVSMVFLNYFIKTTIKFTKKIEDSNSNVSNRFIFLTL